MPDIASVLVVLSRRRGLPAIVAPTGTINFAQRRV